ncbi:MAG: hypothetical protein ACLFVJ_20225 [Persicimonas sp.]
MELRLRPRFGLRVSLSPDQVLERFRHSAESTAHPCDVSVLDRQVEMTVRTAEQHFWSPYLNVLLETDRGHTVLRGKFGPNINVWTMFVAAYAVLGLVGLVGLIAATSQLQIDQPPSGLVLSAGCLFLSALVWVAGKLGQRWAYDQMVVIHLFVHELFADVIADEIYCEACEDDEQFPSPPVG